MLDKQKKLEEENRKLKRIIAELQKSKEYETSIKNLTKKLEKVLTI